MLALEYVHQASYYLGGSVSRTMHVPEGRGDCYIFWSGWCSNWSNNSHNITIGGTHVSELGEPYQYNWRSSVGGSSNDASSGYVKIPDSYLGSTVTIVFDWDGSNPGACIELQMWSGVGYVTDHLVDAQYLDEEYPFQSSVNLGLGEALPMFAVIYDGSGPGAWSWGDNGWFLGGYNWSAANTYMKQGFDFAKSAPKASGFDIDNTENDNYWVNAWVISPDWTVGNNPWVFWPSYVDFSGSQSSPKSLTLDDEVDLLILLTGNANTDYLSSASYNGDAMTHIVRSDRTDGQNVYTDAWYLWNPDTGSAYDLSWVSATNGAQKFGIIPVCGGNFDTPIGPNTSIDDGYKSATTGNGSHSLPTFETQDSGSLLLSSIAFTMRSQIPSLGNGGWPMPNNFQDYWAINQFGSGMSWSPSGGGTSPVLTWYPGASDWYYWAALAFEVLAGPGGDSAPMPVMLGHNF